MKILEGYAITLFPYDARTRSKRRVFETLFLMMMMMIKIMYVRGSRYV